MLIIAAGPLIFTFLIVERLIEESMAVGLNEQVVSGLRSGVDLYKEAIQSRIQIIRLQEKNLISEKGFIKALQSGQAEAIQEQIEGLINTNQSVSQVRVLAGYDEIVRATSPLTFPKNEWKSKTDVMEIFGDYRIEITYNISHKFLSDSDSLRELVLTLEDVKENFQPWKMGYFRLFLFIYTWILIAAVAFGLWLSRSVTGRVAKLVQATKQVARGDLGVRVVSTSRDEIGSLSNSFNQMMDEIQRGRDRIVYLEKISSWQEIARRLAHEIKNPLTPIQLAIQELHRSYNGDDQRFMSKLNDSAEIIEEEVTTLRRLVETFAEFAKMPQVQAVNVELNSFVSEFVKHNPQFADQIEFSPGEPAKVSLDRTLMRQVLVNLVTNAIEAGGPSDMIKIKIAKRDDWVSLRIIDQGSGIAPEAQSMIFQPYFTTKAKGTGLGLAIVKKIVLQHGGEISIEESQDTGTVFRIRLRTLDADEEVEEEHEY
jgi:nitrogen fixation/metabolism regulation signal transduction histidine kinase